MRRRTSEVRPSGGGEEEETPAKVRLNRVEQERPDSPAPSCVSLKSDRSMQHPLKFKDGQFSVAGRVEQERPDSPAPSRVSLKSDRSTPCTEDEPQATCQQKLKSSLKKKFECLFEGTAKQGNPTLLNDIYTELYITKGGSGGINEEHEVRHIERKHRLAVQETTIKCRDIFTASPGKGSRVRTALTLGVAGIGKTVSVHKFILDWAEGKANKDLHFIFALPFRDLNLMKGKDYSLIDLVHHFVPEMKEFGSAELERCKTLFILDGLDESRLPLDFRNNESCSDVTKTTCLDVLLTNLMKGNLLPSALIWITSRPAAAGRIPPERVHRVTEIRGFGNPQKEEYFRKRFSDEDLANRVITHVKSTRSLYIMCHIPVFCWISASVLEKLFGDEDCGEIPKTLTQMYTHFLMFQTSLKNEKYLKKEATDPLKSLQLDKEFLVKLGKLAFTNLETGNLIFYEEDLKEFGIDVSEASVYSGVCTEIFKQEVGLYEGKVYCFVHLTVQEFLAAFHTFLSGYDTDLLKKIVDQVDPSVSLWDTPFCIPDVSSVIWSCCHLNPTPQLDFESNTQTVEYPLSSLWDTSRSVLDVPKCSVMAIEDSLLVEDRFSVSSLGDDDDDDDDSEYDYDYGGDDDAEDSFIVFLKRSVDQALESKNGHLDLYVRFLLGLSADSYESPLQGLLTESERRSYDTWEMVAYINKKLKEDLSPERIIYLFHCLMELNEDFQVKKVQRYLNRGRLSKKRIKPTDWSALAFILLMSAEELDVLDLRNCTLDDGGLQRMLPVVRISRTALLSGCRLTDRCCEDLASTLSSECNLEVLNLSDNDLQDSGVKKLSAGLRSEHCTLHTLRLSGCCVTEEGCASLASALGSNPSHLRELDLSYNHPGASGVKLLSDLLEDPQYRLEELNVDHGGQCRISPGLRKYSCQLTLDPNTANRYLYLSEDNRKVTWREEEQSLPHHPDGFDWWPEVLCVESLTGRCYWEVQWGGTGAEIGVTYKGTERKEDSDNSWLECNDKCWSLTCSKETYNVNHRNQSGQTGEEIGLPEPPCDRVGVYLDWAAGTLSFYSVSSRKRTLLYKFTSTFTEPLYPAFWVDSASSVSLCDLG